MHYIVYLSVEGLYASYLHCGECTSKASYPAEQPLVIHRDRRVIDINASARQFGARVGTTLTEAKAMLSGVQYVEWNPDMDDAARASWLDPLVEVTDYIESGEPHEAYLDLSAHPDPMSFLPKLVAMVDLPVRMGLGASKWIARATANDLRKGIPSADYVVRPVAALKPYPTQALPIPEDMHSVPQEAVRPHRSIDLSSISGRMSSDR
jgi:hypothetical protein